MDRPPVPSDGRRFIPARAGMAWTSLPFGATRLAPTREPTLRQAQAVLQAHDFEGFYWRTAPAMMRTMTPPPPSGGLLCGMAKVRSPVGPLTGLSRSPHTPTGRRTPEFRSHRSRLRQLLRQARLLHESQVRPRHVRGFRRQVATRRNDGPWRPPSRCRPPRRWPAPRSRRHRRAPGPFPRSA